MSGIRSWTAALLAALAILPAGAWAVGPGDSVSFTIPDSGVGDNYAVYVEGSQVGSGVDTTEAAGFSGSYVMPHRGVWPRSVGVVVAVTRADGTSRYHAHTVDYALPTSASSPPSPAGPTGSAPAPKPRAERRAGSGPQDSISVLGAVRRSARGTHRSSARAARKAKQRRARKRRRPKLNQVGRQPDPPAVHGRDVAAPRDTRRDLSGDEFPGLGYSIAWQLLAAVAMAGVLLVALLTTRSRSRRRLLAEEAAMELELQQLVIDLEDRHTVLR